MLLDSNIIIYASLPGYEALVDLIRLETPRVSVISQLEVLGYHQILEDELNYFNQFFAASMIIPMDSDIVDRAIQLRQQQKMSLGDSIIAATALVHGLKLITRNSDDFNKIPELEWLNPIDT